MAAQQVLSNRSPALRRLRASLILSVALAGCYGYRPARVAPEPGTRVRLVFIAATTIRLSPATAEDPPGLYENVLEASGVIEATSRDTIALRLGELRSADGPIAVRAHAVALVPVDRVARVSERHLAAGRTALGGAGMLLLAMTTLIVLLIITVTKAAAG